MGDALRSLLDALRRVSAEVRSRRKKKRPQKPGGPRPSGPGANKGCGTGAGGFGKGNSCAKEDGIPNAPRTPVMQPVDAKGNLAKAAAIKKSPEYKKAQKQKKIDALRRAAAERKAQKGERDAAEKKAAAAAAAKKRAAMLQKIRVKKANERLQVIEKPASVFSGSAIQATKSAGETEVEFQIRRHKHDLDRLHSESERIENAYAEKLSLAQKEMQYLHEDRSKHSLDVKMFNSRNKEWHEKQKQIDDSINAKQKEIESLDRERDGRVHALFGEFTRAYNGGTATVSTNPAEYKIDAPRSLQRRREVFDGAKEMLKDVWGWLSRTAAPKHSATIARQKLIFRAGAGGTHDGKNEEVTIGIDGTSTFRKTGVHEYGHAIENADARTLRALDEDFTKRADAFFASERGAKIMGIDGCTYYECVYKAGEQRQKLNLDAPSHLGYARRYSDCGYDAATRERHKNDPRYNRGTEVFSTGVESLYSEPTQFRKRARHGYDLSVLILAGRL